MKPQNLFIVFITLFTAFPCVSMEISNEPDIDLTRKGDKEYLLEVYQRAPENVKRAVQFRNFRILEQIYNDRNFANALVKFYRDFSQEIVKDYPKPEYKIGKITNQTSNELDIVIQVQRGGLVQRVSANPNESLDINTPIPNGRLYARDIFFYIKQQGFSLELAATENKEIIARLLSGNKIIDETISKLVPWDTTYEVNITFAGENLEESKIEIILTTDLFKAVKEIDYEKVKEIVKQGFNILMQDEEGNTVLHYAALNDWKNPQTEQIFGFLLSVNSQLLSITNNEGETPLSLVPIEIREKIQNFMAEKQAMSPEKEKKSSE